MEILIEVDRVCRKNNIKYQIFAGTLLGAIRHKGFIPWDDDIDILMPRDEYNKFLLACKTDLDSRFFLQNYDTDKNYFHAFVRVRRNGTYSPQLYTEKFKMHHGVFIDVFPFDKVPLNARKAKKQFNTLVILRKLKDIRKNAYKSKNILKRFLKFLRFIPISVFPIRFFNKLENKVAQKFNETNSPLSTMLVENIKSVYKRCMLENKYLYEQEFYSFEGLKFIGPENYKMILHNLYGDFLKFPPLEERTPHHNISKLLIAEDIFNNIVNKTN